MESDIVGLKGGVYAVIVRWGLGVQILELRRFLVQYSELFVLRR
jgi:hypothetical protein